MAFDVDLRDLRYFEKIAELQHVGRAAQALHRTQPALTSAVRRLEEACGAPLFEKAGRGIRLSSAGTVLLKWAQRMRFDMEDARREIAELGKGISGQVRIGIVPTAAQFILPAAARQLLHEAPNVSLKTVVGLVDTMKPLLQAGELDLMVGTESSKDPRFASDLLAEDQIVVAAHARHELFQGKVKLGDLTRYQWVLQPAGAPTRDWLDHTFERKGLPRPQVKVEASMLLILPALIAETGLLSFIPRRQLGGAAGVHLKEIKLWDTTMRRRLAVTYRKDSYLSPAAKRMLHILEQTASQQSALSQ
ncbi:LysR substrate-binding domain-containing protein [Noviherbaspirillum massiliense]|uniref:LysR substrate-binding domain-containing protein n=1 Tax=Noviherbaspirillum massiliense TaxID=1465823 RepID=UPI0002EF0BD2|nr:LysR substrate-binding domain-containing protein [Noviherbaspirillum massiliense]